MRRLLVLPPSLPYPPQSGGSIRAFNVLKRLARDFEIQVVIGAYGRVARDAMEAFARETGVSAVHQFIRKDAAAHAPLTRFDLWKHAPHGLTLRRRPEYVAVLRRVLAQTAFDAALIECSYMFQYRKDLGSIPVFLSAYDVDSLKLRRWFEADRLSLRRRARHTLQYWRLRRWESRLGRRAAAVFVTSRHDCDLLGGRGRRGRFIVAPNGVDAGYFTPRDRQSFEGRPAVAFVGSLFYRPNLEAARFLRDSVMPRVRASIPGAELHIVGRTEGCDVAGWNRPAEGIRLHADAPDIRPLLRAAQVFATPIFIGSGTRIKILEAMASGTPVVSTAIGAEGIDCVHGRDILIADAPDAMAASIAGLLQDRDRAFAVGCAGRRLVEASYTWDRTACVVRETIDAALDGVAGGKARDEAS